MNDQVVLRLPAASAYLSVLRTATASLASRLDFTVDDIEDLRIAVDEACALLLPHATNGAELECVFDLAPGALTVSVTVPTDAPAPLARDSFAWTVLNALVGEVTSDVTGDGVTVSLIKKRGASP
jgi:serine/threonine-protein kinase RsbW